MIRFIDLESKLKTHVEHAGIVEGLDEFGHITGDAMESWIYDVFSTMSEFQTFKPHDFLNRLAERPDMDLEKFLNRVWWSKLLLIGKPKPNDEAYKKTQQEGADLILCDNWENIHEDPNVVLVNVKSHNAGKSSRDPNIMSALRLLKFLKNILINSNRDIFLDQMSYWFVSVSHMDNHIKTINMRDLFLLDTTQIPLINFDAAIQIQWHVHKMIQIPTQTKLQFIEGLTSRFEFQWSHHKESKDRIYGEMIKDIKNSLDGI